MLEPLQPQPDIWESNPKLKSLLLVLIVVFLISGIGLAAFSQWSTSYRQKVYEETKAGLPKHQGGVSEIQNVGVSDTATWKTYRNEKYGFEFRYPDGSLNDNPNDNFVPNEYDHSIMKVTVATTLDGRPDAILYSVTLYNTQVGNIINNLKKTYTGVTLDIADGNFQGFSAKTVSYSTGDGKVFDGVYITKGEYVYGIGGINFNQILPTFKFIK